MPDTTPSIGQLWHQANGDNDEYRRLMIEHGYLVQCGCPCHSDGSGHCEACKPRLPCGWSPGG